MGIVSCPRSRLCAMFLISLVAVALCLNSHESAAVSFAPFEDWHANWIGIIGGSKPNTWMCYRKQFNLDKEPAEAIARIACDSKYWLWINGELAVFEGQLKRGPTPQDTYFDRVDLKPHLRSGTNTIAILVNYFGQHGYSHNSSGKAALIFDGKIDGKRLLSEDSWKVKIHPAYGTTDPPKDNVRQPEWNVRFDARHDLGDWHQPEFDDSSWGPPTDFGKPPVSPWNRLFERPIPQWTNSGVIDYEEIKVTEESDDSKKYICHLPYNCQVTPFLRVKAPAGQVICIHSDIQEIYGRFPLIEIHRHEYVTREGLQEFELPTWINGHQIHYLMPAEVEVLDLKYRETGYDTEFIGKFSCNDEHLNQLWTESLRTLYVTMRDTYMDCPDRERAQWWGDAVNEIGEAFYALDAQRAPQLARKAIYELVRWQRNDNTLYSPVPSGIRRPGIEFPLDGSWNQELPQQMLASIGWYGFWNYYWYSADQQTIQDAYPAVKRYLSLWQLGDDGLVIHRPGGWDWTDWGTNIDVPVIENAWFYLALKGASAMAKLSGHREDLPTYQKLMQSIEKNYHSAFWQEKEFRSRDYQGETDDRANAMAVVAGLARAADFPAITQVLEKEHHASPYMEKYVLEALLLMNEPEIAIDRMKRRYAQMLVDDQTTLWECFEELELEGFGSLGHGTYNHAWSGGPLTILSQYVAGVSPTAPGFKTFQVFPQMGTLNQLAATIPTHFGLIELEIEREAESPFRLQLTSPPETTAQVGIPRSDLSPGASILLNNQRIWTHGETQPSSLGITLAGGDKNYLKVHLPSGKWQIEVVEGNDARDDENLGVKSPTNALSKVEQQSGFRMLFNGKSLDQWRHQGNWTVDRGAIHRSGAGGALEYVGQLIPDDFELRFEWKVAKGANSGVYYRPGQYEYQILDNQNHADGKNPRTSAASLYFCMSPSHDATHPVGEWNTARIICQGTVIQHWLNDTKVVDFDYADPKWAANLELLRKRGGNLEARGGHLQLQDHGDPVWYRNIRLRTLAAEDPLDRTPVQPAKIPAAALELEEQILESIKQR